MIGAMSAPSPFDPGSIDAFRVVGWDFDEPSRTLRLRYALDQVERFEEIIEFVTEPTVPGQLGMRFERAVDHLHIAAGASYYKTAAPRRVVVESTGLTPMERRFHQLLYDQGLREFAVANGRPVPVDVRIEAQGATGWRLPPPSLPHAETGHRRPLVPIGGGKDSMVLIEALRSLDPLVFAVNPRPVVDALVAEVGLDVITVRRQLDPALLELNARGALNGHVPITAIVSLIAVVGSAIYGYNTIAMAIERSASEETSVVDGVPVNHQFSKSREFETSLQGLIAASIDPSITYGSALRPYSELAIARAFAGLRRYHRLFVSCNTAFRLDAAAGTRWCGRCPKCRFVGLALAPFLGRAELTDIIGRDMFADGDEVSGFGALVSDDEKPFECVGERRESAIALNLLGSMPEWRDTPVVRALAPVVADLVSDTDVAQLWAPDRYVAFPDTTIDGLVRQLLEPGPGPVLGPDDASGR